MFDKNAFKDAFRRWVALNPGAGEEDAREFCQAQIPAKVCVQYYWLVTQSLEWFRWQKRRTEWADEDLALDEQATAC
jgi:hypothetical protein